MDFYSLQDKLKRHSNYAFDDLCEFSSHIEEMISHIDRYIPFTGDIHSELHFDLKFHLHLLRARLLLLEAEFHRLYKMLNK